MIPIPNSIKDNQGKVKSNKQRFKYSSGDSWLINNNIFIFRSKSTGGFSDP